MSGEPHAARIAVSDARARLIAAQEARARALLDGEDADPADGAEAQLRRDLLAAERALAAAGPGPRRRSWLDRLLGR